MREEARPVHILTNPSSAPYQRSQSQSVSIAISKPKPIAAAISRAHQAQSEVAQLSQNQSLALSSHEERDESSRAWILNIDIKRAAARLQESLNFQKMLHGIFLHDGSVENNNSDGSHSPNSPVKSGPSSQAVSVPIHRDKKGAGPSLHALYLLLKDLCQRLKAQLHIEISDKTHLNTLLSYRYELKKLNKELAQLSISLSPHKDLPPDKNIESAAVNEKLEMHIEYLNNECDRINHETALVVVQELIDKKLEKLLAENDISDLIDIDASKANDEELSQALRKIGAREYLIFAALERLKTESASLQGRMQSWWYALKLWELPQHELAKLKSECDANIQVYTKGFDTLLIQEMVLEKLLAYRDGRLDVAQSSLLKKQLFKMSHRKEQERKLLDNFDEKHMAEKFECVASIRDCQQAIRAQQPIFDQANFYAACDYLRKSSLSGVSIPLPDPVKGKELFWGKFAVRLWQMKINKNQARIKELDTLMYGIQSTEVSKQSINDTNENKAFVLPTSSEESLRLHDQICRDGNLEMHRAMLENHIEQFQFFEDECANIANELHAQSNYREALQLKLEICEKQGSEQPELSLAFLQRKYCLQWFLKYLDKPVDLQRCKETVPASEQYQKAIAGIFKQGIEFNDVVFSNIPLENTYIGVAERALNELQVTANIPSNTAYEVLKKIVQIYFDQLLQDPRIKQRDTYQPLLAPELDQLLAMYSNNPSDPEFYSKAISFLQLEQHKDSLIAQKSEALAILSTANNTARNLAALYKAELPLIDIKQMRADGKRTGGHYSNIAKCLSVLDQQVADAQGYQASLMQRIRTTFDTETLIDLLQQYASFEIVKANACTCKAEFLVKMYYYEQVATIIHEQDVLYQLQQNFENQAGNTNVSFNINSLPQTQQQTTARAIQQFIDKDVLQQPASSPQSHKNTWLKAIRSYPLSASVQNNNNTLTQSHVNPIKEADNIPGRIYMHLQGQAAANIHVSSSMQEVQAIENIIVTQPLHNMPVVYEQHYVVHNSKIWSDATSGTMYLTGNEMQHAIHKQNCEMLNAIEALWQAASEHEQGKAYIQITQTACLAAIRAAEAGNIELALKYMDLAQALFDHAEYTLIKAGLVALGAAKGALKGSVVALKAPLDTAQLAYKIVDIFVEAAYYTAQDPVAAMETAGDGIGSCFNTFFVSDSADRKAFCEKMTILMQSMSDGFEDFKNLPLEDQVEFLTETAAAFYVTPSKALAKIPWLDESIKSLSKAMKVEAAALQSIMHAQSEYNGMRANTEVIQRIKKIEEQLGRALSSKELTEAVQKIEQEILHSHAPILIAGIRSINSLEKIESRVQSVAKRLSASGVTIQPHAIKNTQKLLAEQYHKFKKLEQHTHAQELVKLLEQEALTCEELLHLVNRFDHSAELAEIANKIPELAGKQLTWDFLHFLRPDVNISRSGEVFIDGWHKFHEGIARSGHFAFEKVTRFEHHPLLEIYDITVQGKKIANKVYFPRAWSEEKIMEKVIESMKNISKIRRLDGKLEVLGTVSEGFKIKTYININNGKILSPFPFCF